MSEVLHDDPEQQDGDVEFDHPEPYTIGDPGRSYSEIGGGKPFPSAMPPDSVCDAFDHQGWALRAASVRGLMHRSDGSPRQDAYAVRYSPDKDRLVVAVCDGVGSAPESHVASDMAANFLVDRAVDAGTLINDDWWTEVFHDASDALAAAARNAGASDPSPAGVRQVMATTAILAAVDNVSVAGPWTVQYAGVGDSSLWLTDVSTDEDTSWIPILGGKHTGDGIATNRTSALPVYEKTCVQPEQFILLEGQLLLVCTDGVGDAFGSGMGEVAQTLRRSWMNPPTALNFAAQVSFGRRRLLDDRTGVALWAPTR
ncbi:protein phosphatase 2C domain-containing protein [Rhodococcus sp. HM1]|uniref:protein phosphatase 2C domain-containing protein n=1 Tax=Rhodococcus sp. HM1 TaxID=2937759 RepID=UPI00200AC8D5|nr:protein phosphatase 2C domain-containing protein [Rhodococcus sp. HM1]MCK8672241.1 protein phosphatase 2C domain-containing protein [Rhodococcus sp. HM1]